MKIAFSICSNNYLAQAITLGNSLLQHNPDYRFFICLCDVQSREIDYARFAPIEIIEVSTLDIPDFSGMCAKYNIIELNTSIKPFAFAHFFAAFPEASHVVYLDPDTYVYAPLSAMEKELAAHTGLLTPHILSPVGPDDYKPTEDTFTLYGVYNLGFLALRPGEETKRLLDWWMRRLAVNCFNRPEQGVFVDQLPMVLAVVFFRGLRVSADMGLNVAPWNLHERRLGKRDGRYFVNETSPLIFFHFSKFRPGASRLTMAKYNRPNLGESQALEDLRREYEQDLLANGYDKLRGIACAYGLPMRPSKLSFWARLRRSCRKRLGLEKSLGNDS